MINRNLLFSNILENRCTRGNQVLSSGEAVISKSEMPSLYGGEKSNDDRNYLKKVIESLEPSDESEQLFDKLRDCETALGVELFYLRVMTVFPDLLEAVLHQFVHRFWDKIDSKNAPGFPRDLELFYKARGTPGTVIENNLLQRLRSAGCHCDLVGYSKTDKCLWLIDVKRDGIDDRAVGQIRRYYSIANEIIETHDINMSVRLIRPALVCREVSVSRFFSLGVPFRDVCEIWTYSVDGKQFILHEKRLQLLGQIRRGVHLNDANQ